MRGLSAKGRSRLKTLVCQQEQASTVINAACHIECRNTHGYESEALRNHVTAEFCISDRLMALEVDIGKSMMRIISAYAPQVGYTAEKKNSFYEDLEHYVHSIGDEEVLLLAGDISGHIGRQREGFDG
ncbi:hypothetical protein Aduo_014855 [Ancylostoma duodenale]